MLSVISKRKKLVAFLIITIIVLFRFLMYFFLENEDIRYRTELANVDGDTGLIKNTMCLNYWNEEGKFSTFKEECALQKHILQHDINHTPLINGEVDNINPEEDKRTFYQAFLEFGESGKFATDDFYKDFFKKQLNDLKNHLKNKKQNYLIVYVHGWRHNAQIDDEDVSDARIFAAYARSFLNQRCKEQNRYCDATVTSLYIGWRGARINENFGIISEIAAIFSLFDRKPQSESVSSHVTSVLNDVWNAVQKDNTKKDNEYTKDKMIVVGHSLGGNLLLTGLSQIIGNQINSHSPEKIVPSPLGDLVVLVNPAAEAKKWIDVQNAVHAKDEEYGLVKNNNRNGVLFSKKQKPVLVSLTSACGFSLNGKQSKQTTDKHCDQDTNRCFPIYRILTGHFSLQDRMTLGHMPMMASESASVPENSVVGPTHQLDINFSPLKATDIKSALNKNLSRCDIVDGWLLKARKRTAERFGKFWDAGVSSENLTPINSGYHAPPPQRLESQFMHGFTRQAPKKLFDQNRRRPASSGYDPYWNVKAHTGAITGHNGFISYQTWCALNQLVLDDITADNLN
jgi:hypothetical protein